MSDASWACRVCEVHQRLDVCYGMPLLVRLHVRHPPHLPKSRSLDPIPSTGLSTAACATCLIGTSYKLPPLRTLPRLRLQLGRVQEGPVLAAYSACVREGVRHGTPDGSSSCGAT